MRKTNSLVILCGLFLVAVAAISGCNRSSTETPVPTSPINATQSYETAVARVTEFYLETVQASDSTPAAVEPTESSDLVEPTATETDIPETETPVPPTARPTNTPEPCDRAAPGDPIDVTIPDDTEMITGQAFEKTWRLVNVGTCTWNSNYAVVWISGEQMGDDDVVFISGTVAPGQTIDITVPMTAPENTGAFQSNWKLRNDTGVLFGIGDNADRVFWARIEVVEPTATPTITPTPTATLTGTLPAATATTVPVVHASNSSNLVPSDSINLDNIQVNPGSGEDINYSVDAGSNHILTPVNGALIGVFGISTPGYGDCQVASLGSAAVAVESVGVDHYLCYKTNSGRPGRLYLSAFNSTDGALSVDAVTWVAP